MGGQQRTIRDVLSCVRLSATPWPVAHQAPLSMKSSKYCSGLPFPTPVGGGIFPTQGSNLCLWHLLRWQADSLPPGKPTIRDRGGGEMIQPKVVYDTKAKGREVQGAGISSVNYWKEAEEDEY